MSVTVDASVGVHWEGGGVEAGAVLAGLGGVLSDILVVLEGDVEGCGAVLVSADHCWDMERIRRARTRQKGVLYETKLSIYRITCSHARVEFKDG